MLQNKKHSFFANITFVAKAMASHKLGQDEHAEVALQRLRDLHKEKLIIGEKQVQAFLDKAEKLLSSDKQ